MTGIIILAAGQSARMGSPKQNLSYKGKTLLQHAVDEATASVCEPVMVILGAYADEIPVKTDSPKVSTIINTQWTEGMASSIRTGIAQMQKNNAVTACIIMLCDQPFVDAQLINQLVTTQYQSKKGIIACTYKQTTGVPVLFSRAYFSQLLQLQGNHGARRLLTQYQHDTAIINFNSGAIDIDTSDDYTKLL